MAITDEEGRKLNKTELRDIALNFIIVGRNATVQAMPWMLYSLLINPGAAKNLMVEVEQHMTDDLEIDLGQKLATLESLMAITIMLKTFEFTLLPGQIITYGTCLTLPMKGGMYAYVKQRT